MNLSELLARAGIPVPPLAPGQDGPVRTLAPLWSAEGPETLTFSTGDAAGTRALLEGRRPGFLLCRTESNLARARTLFPGTVILPVPNPRLAFVLASEVISGDGSEPGGPGAGRRQSGPQVDASAVVDPEARLGPGTVVGPHAFVGPGCILGPETRVEAGARLLAGTRCGAGVRILPGAILGADGFGFERDVQGRLHRFPHQGRVELEDGVEVGANATVDRAAFGATRVGEGTCIDNLAYVAHNVVIGRRCLIMAGCIVAGSAVIEDGAELAPGAVVRDKCRVGAGARVGLGAVVVRDVPPGATVAGVPARAFPVPGGSRSSRP